MEGIWPGYPTRIVKAELPPWMENRWLERELAEDDGINAGDDPFYVASQWIPPKKEELIKLSEGG
jgi:hypothetical protein